MLTKLNITCSPGQTHWNRAEVADALTDRVMNLIPHLPTDKRKNMEKMLSSLHNERVKFITNIDTLIATLTKWEFLYLDSSNDYYFEL